MSALENYKDAAAEVILTPEFLGWYEEVKRIMRSDWSDWRVDVESLKIPLPILVAVYVQSPAPYDASSDLYDFYYHYSQR